MRKLLLLLAATLLPLMACTAEEPETPAADAPAPAAAAPTVESESKSPTAAERPAEPVEESAALDDAAPADDVELALDEPDKDAAAAGQSRFVAGKDYRVLTPTQPTSSPPDQVEVAEVFWYGCPHCFAFEPYLAKWKETAPSYINFVRIPAVWNDRLRMHARAFYTAEALGKLEELHPLMFRAIHVEHRPLATEDELKAFFAEHGVDEQEFHKVFTSFDVVEVKMRQADKLNRRYGVSSVPTVIINGKYVTDGEMAGGFDTLLNVIDELAASEHE